MPLAPKDNQESRWWSEDVGAPMVDNGITRRASIPMHTETRKDSRGVEWVGRQRKPLSVPSKRVG